MINKKKPKTKRIFGPLTRMKRIILLKVFPNIPRRKKMQNPPMRLQRLITSKKALRECGIGK